MGLPRRIAKVKAQLTHICVIQPQAAIGADIGGSIQMRC